MNKYWIERIQSQSDILFNKSVVEIEKELRKLYRKAYADNQSVILELWNKIKVESATGEVRPNDLYRFQRYFDMSVRLQEKLRSLGSNEVELLTKMLERNYRDSYNLTSKLLEDMGLVKPNTVPIDQSEAVKEVLNSVWCSDGKHWSDRIWDHKARLTNKIEQGLIDCVARGASKDVLVGEIKEDFNTGFFNADRLVRTELTYVQNQAAANRYKDAGIKKYEFLAEIDGRTSNICKSLDGKVFKFTDMTVGVNMPPCHPFCRSTIVPVVKTP